MGPNAGRVAPRGLVERDFGAAHVSMLAAEVGGNAVGGARADAVPVAESAQPLTLVGA